VSKKEKAPPPKFAAQNRKARFEYEILEKLETGMVLLGSEVKSLRAGKASIEEAYAAIDPRSEVYLINANIPEYRFSSYLNHDPKRKRKLLLHGGEIFKLRQKLKEKGLTLVPLAIYWKDGRAKCELALAKGRRKFDKREAIRRREDRREMGRVFRKGS